MQIAKVQNLGTVKLSCLKHCQRPFVRIIFSRNFMPWTIKIQHLFNLFFFLTVVVTVFFLLFVFLQNIFCKSSNTQGIIHTLHKHLARGQDRGGHCSLQEITPSP